MKNPEPAYIQQYHIQRTITTFPPEELDLLATLVLDE